MDPVADAIGKVDLGAIVEPEFTIGGSNFQVKLLMPMEGYRVWEILRPHLFEPVSRIDVSVPMQNAVVAIVMGLAPAIVETTRVTLFERIVYTNDTTRSPTVLSRNEDDAFKDAHALTIYEVLVRAFAINFRPSLEDLVSRFGWVLSVPVDSTPSAPGTSSLSSLTP